MEINSFTSPNPRQVLVDEMALLAKSNAKAQSKVKWLQSGLVLLELAIYLLTYFLLFVYKVLPEYTEAGIRNFWGSGKGIDVFDDYLFFFIGYIGMFFLMLYQKQYYKFDKENHLSDELGRIIGSAIICFLISVGFTFILKNTLVYSRFMLLSFLCLVIVEAALFRQLRLWILIALKRYGIIHQNILVVGAGRIGKQLRRQIEKSQSSATIIGFLDDNETGSEIIGKIKDLEHIIVKGKVNTLYITIPSARDIINPMLNRAYKYQIDIRIIPEHFNHISTIYEYRHDYQFPCLQIVKTPLRGLNLYFKRLMDIILSLIGILIITPLVIIVALTIKCSSEGPIFYKQQRIGKNSLPFMMYKFRTMVINADELKQQLLGENEAQGLVFKIKKDPRVTSIGTFLRKYSIDELPQLINVLRGEMSLIGPRPPLPEEVERYTDVHWRRLDVRPGMTGLWQVSGRSDLTFDEWIDLDIQYIERWSLGLELKILLKTIPTVIKGRGAY
jgi:exopolysaccharide biosynthesis polyprenyl glycosylphosphotransferase